MTVTQSQAAKVGRAFRVVLPPQVRQALGIREGDRVVFRVDGAEVRVQSMREFSHAIQAKYAGLLEGAVDELIAERRAEAARDD